MLRAFSFLRPFVSAFASPQFSTFTPSYTPLSVTCGLSSPSISAVNYPSILVIPPPSCIPAPSSTPPPTTRLLLLCRRLSATYPRRCLLLSSNPPLSSPLCPYIPFAPSSTLRVIVSSAVVYVQLVHAIVCPSLSMPSISATIYSFVLVSPPRLRLCPRRLQVFIYSVSYALRGRLRYHLPFRRYLQHCGHLLHCHRRHLSSKPSSLFTKVPVVQLAPNAVVWAKEVYLSGSRIDSSEQSSRTDLR